MISVTTCVDRSTQTGEGGISPNDKDGNI